MYLGFQQDSNRRETRYKIIENLPHLNEDAVPVPIRACYYNWFQRLKANSHRNMTSTGAGRTIGDQSASTGLHGEDLASMPSELNDFCINHLTSSDELDDPRYLQRGQC